jgi:hypothetical protein
LTPGILPFAATRPAALFAPLQRRSARAKKKVTKKESTLRRALGFTSRKSAKARTLPIHWTEAQNPRFGK